ncbi:3-dehydroquinate synthase [Niabella ginsengisoli]|uniref:3-dehydroquinate synthase n=1 Tax=Niabella ginsengisoli TaxID=522298 RepID=A0ABS9SFG7_9BACT|nr:3-dehydroquinate synthase [Niabella ginsengisoli]MCH5597108.1 3-dehydroquinate synthase [Niabella ginsengisoli]
MQTIKFSNASTDFYFDSSLKQLGKIVDKQNAIVITDQNIFNAHESRFKSFNTIVIPAGEEQKKQSTVDDIILKLIQNKADRKSVLVGVGGGVITDLTGYTASVYMRGIPFGFVPTTILGLVDASIGGKNGIDVGVYKNMVGIIRQPSFLLHDLTLLQSLPEKEWQNGFAEIIKHACIKDAAMFKQLEQYSLKDFKADKTLLAELIKRNALIKTKVVQKDEFEKGDRRLLNFGHTIGHAIETQYNLMHGEAVAIGMVFASEISHQLKGFKEQDRVKSLIEKYQLPTTIQFDAKKVFEVLAMDKKRVQKEMNFVLLDKVGKAVVHPIALKQLEKIINKL